MVNYKRVVCEVAVLAAVLAIAYAAPAPDCVEKHFDQRQNGTENIRVNIDGVLIAVAPAEALVEAASGLADLFDISDLEDLIKPPSLESSSVKPDSDKPTEVISSDTKPEKPETEKPAETPNSDVFIYNNSGTKPQRKDAATEKQEKVKRLKHRLANVLIPLLRRTRHQ